MGKKGHKKGEKTSKLTKKEKKRQNHLKIIQGGKEKSESSNWQEDKKKAS